MTMPLRLAGTGRLSQRSVEPAQWLSEAKRLYGEGWWFEAEWGEGPPSNRVFALWGRRGELERLETSAVDGGYPSLTTLIPAADWFERALRDRTGLVPRGHIDPRPFLFHESYPPGHVEGRPLSDSLEPQSPEFPFLRHEGVGVFEIPVGPIHAGIIEPGHFRFTTAGELILDVELRLNYSHKGTLSLAKGKHPEHALRLLERLSGDNAAAHACAFAAAVEAASGTPAPAEVEWMRTAMVELERLYNHLGDLAGIATDVAFAAGAAHFQALRERMLRWNQRLFGHRLMMNAVAVGAFHRAPTRGAWREFAAAVPKIRRDFLAARRVITQHSGLKERVEGTGHLAKVTAELLSCVGPTARASGVLRDARVDAPCLGYSRLGVSPVTKDRGTVSSRMLVKVEEADAVLGWMDKEFRELGLDALPPPMETGATGEGVALVEASRGAVLSWVRLRDGIVADVYQRDPSFLNWRGLDESVFRNIVPDFPLINKSFNLSYSGSDA